VPRPKSILRRVEVDEAKRAHNCQHNENHRLERGHRRLKVWNDRSADHYCVLCALNIINRDIAKLRALAQQLQGSSEEASRDQGPVVGPEPVAG
jgi:hypothetical protein